MSRVTARTEQSRPSGAADRPVRQHAADASQPSLPRGAWAILREAVTQAKQNNVTMVAQALAYSFFLAIPSICLVILGVFSLVPSPADVRDLVDRAGSVMPAESTSLLRDSLERSTQSSGSG